jgi:hypothetical protein
MRAQLITVSLPELTDVSRESIEGPSMGPWETSVNAHTFAETESFLS